MDEREHINKGIKEIKSTYDLPDHHLFPMWLISNFHHNGNLSRAVLEDIYQGTYELLQEGFSGDEGLDGFFYDEDACTAYLYQAKWPSELKTKAGKNDALEVAKALNVLLSQSREIDQIPKSCDAWRKVLSDIREVVQQQGEIVLRSVTGGAWSKSYDKDVYAQINSTVRDITKVEFYGAVELSNEIRVREADLSNVNCELELYTGTKDPCLEFPSSGMKGIGHSYVTLLSGFSLAKLAVKHKEKLFARNVRYFLGNKGKKANEQMRETLNSEDDRQTFWYGHNGITVLCDKSSLQGDDPHRPESIKLTNPQIVNGCQTTTTIMECFGEIESRRSKKDFPVLGRVIQLSGTEEERSTAAELIADRTNTQSAVNDADLRANDTVQVRFQGRLEKYGDGWFYERKRGAWSGLPPKQKGKFKQTGKADRLIKRDDYQQAWRSYTGAPSAALTKKGDVWVANSEIYKRVFSDSRRECDVVLVCTLSDWFTQVFAVKGDSSLCVDIFYGLGNHLSEIQRAKSLVVAHSLGMIGHMIRRAYDECARYPEEKAEAVVASLERGRFVRKNWSTSDSYESWGVWKDLIKLVMNTWALYINKVKNDGDSTLYALLKTPTAFDSLCGTVDDLLPHSPTKMVEPSFTQSS